MTFLAFQNFFLLLLKLYELESYREEFEIVGGRCGPFFPN